MSMFWYIPFAVEALVLLVLIAMEMGGWATTTMLATIVVMHMFGFVNVFGTITSHYQTFLIGVPIYIAVGVIWSFVKWIVFVYNRKEEYERAKEAYFERNPNHEHCDWVEYVKNSRQNNYALNNITKPPQASQYKSKITTWMFYWPWSMLSTLFSDFIRRLYTFIYSRIKEVYQKISDKIYSDISEDWK